MFGLHRNVSVLSCRITAEYLSAILEIDVYDGTLNIVHTESIFALFFCIALLKSLVCFEVFYPHSQRISWFLVDLISFFSPNILKGEYAKGM